MEDDLDLKFQEAYEKACNMTEVLAPDVMLKIYAYYKQATQGAEHLNKFQTADLRDGFKMNAWMQVRHLQPNEAKQLYIETINSIIK